MSEKDLKINARVRRILVEHDLDLSALYISTTSGSVLVKGRLRKLSLRRMSDAIIVRTLVMVELSILRTKGVRRVSIAIKDWKKNRGRWKKIKKIPGDKKIKDGSKPEDSEDRKA
jgi:hypothetical protein